MQCKGLVRSPMRRFTSSLRRRRKLAVLPPVADVGVNRTRRRGKHEPVEERADGGVVVESGDERDVTVGADLQLDCEQGISGLQLDAYGENGSDVRVDAPFLVRLWVRLMMRSVVGVPTRCCQRACGFTGFEHVHLVVICQTGIVSYRSESQEGVQTHSGT